MRQAESSRDTVQRRKNSRYEIHGELLSGPPMAHAPDTPYTSRLWISLRRLCYTFLTWNFEVKSPEGSSGGGTVDRLLGSFSRLWCLTFPSLKSAVCRSRSAHSGPGCWNSRQARNQLTDGETECFSQTEDLLWSNMLETVGESESALCSNKTSPLLFFK